MLAIYVRLSGLSETHKKENKIPSIENQIIYGQEFAKEKGLSYKIYKDEGLSGSLFKERLGLQAMIKDIESQLITTVYSNDQSRLERKPAIRYLLNDFFIKHNVSVYNSKGYVDLENPETQLIGDIMSIFNHNYTVQTSHKVKQAKQLNAKLGKSNGSQPYGYMTDKDKQIIVNPEQADTVKFIFDSSYKGIGLRKIAETLNAKGVPTNARKSTKTGQPTNQWYEHTLRQMISNTMYHGKRPYNGQYFDVPAILTKEYFDEVNHNIKTNNKVNSGKYNDYKYLLKNYLRCSCGRNYYGRRRPDKRKGNVYICSSILKDKQTNCKSINIDLIDAIIFDLIFEFSNLKYTDNQIQNYHIKITNEKDKIKHLNHNIKELNNQKNNLIDAVQQGIIKLDEVETQMKQIRSSLTDFEAKLEQSQRIIENSQRMIENREKREIINHPDTLTFEEKRKILNDYVSFIYVHQTPKDTVPNTLSISVNFHQDFALTFKFRNGSGKYIYVNDIPILKANLADEFTDFAKSICSTPTDTYLPPQC